MSAAARAFVVSLGDACRKVRITGDPATAVAAAYPELREKQFKIQYYDDEVDMFVDANDVFALPVKSKLVVTILNNPGPDPATKTADQRRATDERER